MSEQKVALVTGTSAGIGRAIGDALAAAGYQTFGGSRRGTGSNAIENLRLDVRDDASVAAAVAQILGSTGRIDLLVNNAGYAMVGALEESSIEQAKAIFETNLFGVMRMTNAVLPAMRAQGGGRVVHVSSVVGFLPAPFSGLYASTKHALEAYSESLDHEVRTIGIRSILVEPGFTASTIEQNMPVADRQIPTYDKGRAAILSAFSQALASAPSTDTVARAVAKVAEEARPRVRYAVGRDAATLATLRRLLPTRMFERSFRKQFGLEPA